MHADSIVRTVGGYFLTSPTKFWWPTWEVDHGKRWRPRPNEKRELLTAWTLCVAFRFWYFRLLGPDLCNLDKQHSLWTMLVTRYPFYTSGTHFFPQYYVLLHLWKGLVGLQLRYLQQKSVFKFHQHELRYGRISHLCWPLVRLKFEIWDCV